MGSEMCIRDRTLFVALGCSSFDILDLVGALNADSSVAELSRLQYPDVASLLLLLLAKTRYHLLILGIKKSVVDYEGPRHQGKHFLLSQLAVLFQTKKKSLLVAQQPIPRKVVMDYVLNRYQLLP